MAVRDDYSQGKEVGTALLRAALDFADNAAGIPLNKGFEIEGTHCRFALRNGRYVDAYSMARVTD